MQRTRSILVSQNMPRVRYFCSYLLWSSKCTFYLFDLHLVPAGTCCVRDLLNPTKIILLLQCCCTVPGTWSLQQYETQDSTSTAAVVMQTRFMNKILRISVVCPGNGTTALKAFQQTTPPAVGRISEPCLSRARAAGGGTYTQRKRRLWKDLDDTRRIARCPNSARCR